MPDNRSSDSAPRLAISMGDPLGIGPEITVKALADPDLRARAGFVVYGMSGAMHLAADRAGIEPYWWRVRAGAEVGAEPPESDRRVLLVDYTGRPSGEDLSQHLTEGRATREGGMASFRFVEDAIASLRSSDERPRAALGLVTAPISKEAWALAGKARYPGHTELLQSRFGAKRVRMMFVAPRLRVILATGHLPLMDIRNVLTIGRIFDTIDMGAGACRTLGTCEPRIGVCGLNPHAGEAELLGDEESRLIAPAIELARQQGIDVRGPYPGDTIWRDALSGRFDLVVAMYHDQGLIPIKLLEFERAVNATIGLPITRTSPDHGTAYDIAGRNLADEGSMRAAIELALDLAERNHHSNSNE